MRKGFSPSAPWELLRRGVVSLLVAAAATTGVLSGASAAAADDTTVTWGIATGDTEQGAGRANYAYSVDPGQQLNDAVVIKNFSDQPQTIDLYATDAVTTPEGTLDLLPRSQASSDAGTWVALEQNQVTVDPGQSVTVPFAVSVPADARPGDHSAGVVTSLASASGSTGTVTVDRRLGLRMQLRVSGALTQSAEVRNVSVTYLPGNTPFGLGRARVSYTLVNTGNTRITGLENVTVAGPGGLGERARLAEDIGEITVGGELPRVVEVDGVWPSVRLDATVTLIPVGVGAGGGTGEPVSATTGGWAVPWWLVGTVVLLLVAAVAILVGVRIRHRRNEPTETPAIHREAEAPRSPLGEDA